MIPDHQPLCTEHSVLCAEHSALCTLHYALNKTMPIPIIILLILILIYLIFIVGPAAVGLFNVFKRPGFREPETTVFQGNYREPFEKRIKEDSAYLHSLNKKRVWITGEKDGTRLCADFYDQGADKTVIIAHGYSTGPYLNMSAQARWLLDLGYNVLMIYQRAHGPSQGKRSTLGLIEQYDLLNWIDWIDRQTNAKDILIYGASMGATTAAMASDKIRCEKVKALILDSGYTSPYRQMEYEDKKRHLPYFLLMPLCFVMGKIFLKLDIRTSAGDSLKNTAIPCFFLHGTADTTVSIEYGKQNYDACAAEKDRIYIEGANHLMSFMTQEEEVKNRLLSFLQKYIP